MHRVLALLLILTLAVACSQNPGFEPEDQAQLIRDLRTSFVAVEYTLQKDDGDEPQASGMGSRCPNCGGWHGSSVNTAFNEERPAELEGYLIAPTRVILTDPVIHPRFIKKLEVRFGDQAVAAKPVAWARDQYAYMLELEKPLEGAVPLEFDAEAEGPYFFAMQTLGESEPSASLKPFAPQVVLRYEDDAMMASQDMGLVVNTEGTPVGMIYNPELALDDSWKGSPLEWDLVEKDEMEEIDQRIQAIVENKIVRTELIFRSPSGEEDMYSYHHYGRGESFDGTEANVAGMLWDKETLLVLGDLKPDNTARLEKIRVHTKDGAVIEAKFKASLKDLPVMVATLEEPIDNPLDLYSDDLDALRHKLSVGVLVNVVGESREIRTMPFRLMGFQKGREGRYYPQLARLSTAFLFTDDGKLAIFPGGFRDKPWEERYYGSEDMLMQVSLLAERVKDVEQYADTANIPLSEEEENRVAWLGVELQSLNPELARANDVALETKNGQIGALVTRIYPNSPAAEADIKPGSILLNLQIEGEPNPIPVQYQEDYYGFGGSFPWDRLDELPEEYFSDLPSPFPNVENSFNKILTNLGEGKNYTLNMIVNGEKVEKDLVVELGPPHYKSAKRTENEALGVNVRNLTFEVRRYTKLKEEDPGVVISKVEPGSKASVSGIKPYELLTHINGEPVQDVDNFDKAMSEPGEHKLTIKRMAKTRIVTIDLKKGDFEKKEKEEEQE